MITSQLIAPGSIVVIGGSNDTTKPGGKVLKNLLDHHFDGRLYVTNPKETEVQGVKCFQNPSDLPQVDLAILAIAAKYCPATVELLARQKGTKAFIIFSAGFHEESEAGAALERQIVDTINETGSCLIGPNCIGVMNSNYTGTFTTPIPKLDTKGVDFISGSGATAVFIIESGVLKGLTFSSVYSVGNSAQLGVEDVLEYLDNSFDSQASSRVKLLYIEHISDPHKLLKHTSSLIRKGCKIAAVKAGSSPEGIKAASSHTGALASSDTAVDALFRKAGIVRCYGREELTTVASIFMHPELKGKNIAIITHAGGPAVMLTDVLSDGGMNIPPLKSPELLAKLFPGSSVSNPIDFLATGTAEQLGEIIDSCERDFDTIDGMAVIFGSPGLFPVFEVYKVLSDKIKSSRKPIFPILPSLVNVKNEIDYFISLGNICFPDEIAFGKALSKVYGATPPVPAEIKLPSVNVEAIRKVIDNAGDGYLPPVQVQQLLDAAGIPRAGEAVVATPEAAVEAANKLGYPVVMKVVGPVHKSDVGGVVLDVKDNATVVKEFERMMAIAQTTAILIQPMLCGQYVYVGAKYEPKFGHLILCGLGGIYIEVLKDVSVGLSPLTLDEAHEMIRGLRSYKIIQGIRGQEGINEDLYAGIITRVAALCEAAPEIKEMDINPLIGNMNKLTAVDARVRIASAASLQALK